MGVVKGESINNEQPPRLVDWFDFSEVNKVETDFLFVPKYLNWKSETMTQCYSNMSKHQIKLCL